MFSHVEGGGSYHEFDIHIKTRASFVVQNRAVLYVYAPSDSEVWRAWNAKIGEKCQTYMPVAEDLYIRNGSGSNMGSQTYNIFH